MIISSKTKKRLFKWRKWTRCELGFRRADRKQQHKSFKTHIQKGERQCLQ